MAKITLNQLLERGACEDQRLLFGKIFGESVEVTEELALQYTNKFDWNWAAAFLLSAEGRKKYAKNIKAAHKLFDSLTEPAFLICKKTIDSQYEMRTPFAPTTDEERNVIDAAWTLYHNSIVSEKTAYNEACLKAFIAIYNDGYIETASLIIPPPPLPWYKKLINKIFGC